MPRRILTLQVDKDLLDRLEDFRYRRRFASRSQAMKFLWIKGLEADPEPTPEDRERLLARAD